jgi:serine/threonine protein kinase
MAWAASISEDLAAVLAERYDCMSRPLVPPVYNARRVTVRGKACVAKLIFYPEDDGEGGAFNKRRKAGFAMEKYVYPRLRGWPVKLVDSFSSRVGDVVVTTEYANDPWGSYVPSADSDAAVARSLLKQVRAIHRLGVAHGDLLLKNILFRMPRSVAVIDFEKSTRSRRGQQWDYWSLIEALLERKATRGVAFCALLELAKRGDVEVAKKALANAVENIAARQQG